MRLIDADAVKEKIADIWDGRPISFLGARILAMIDEIPTIDAVSEWIPCEERLPSEDGRYLVFCWLMEDMPWISVMYYGKPTFPETDHPCFYVSDDEYGDVEYDDIVAWMPLPKPWKGADDE